MTNEFLSIQNLILLSYDLITLFSRISTIVFSREIAFCGSKKNATLIKLQLHGKPGFQSYYEIIYSDLSILPFVKKDLTVFWKLSDDITGEIANNNNTLEQEEEASSKIDEECSALQKKYTESMDLMVPQISALGVRKQCLQITSPISNQPRINTTEENFAALMTSQYNSDATDIFHQQIFLMYNDGVNDGILDPMDKTSLVSLLNEWQLFGKMTPIVCLKALVWL